VQRGLYTWVTVLSARAFESLPDREVFNHLEEWWGPLAAERPDEVGGVLLPQSECTWQPVGTPAEYLEANFSLPRLRYFDADARARGLGARIDERVIASPGAEIDASAQLDRVVVWPGERVPAGTRATQGVFAGGRFVPCGEGAAA
jgi:mannose-1-phosphate guanylyltransferase